MAISNIRARMIYRMTVEGPNDGEVDVWGHAATDGVPIRVEGVPCWIWIASDRRDFVRYDPQSIRAISAYILVIPDIYIEEPYNITSEFEIVEILDKAGNQRFGSMKIESLDRSHDHMRMRAARYDA